MNFSEALIELKNGRSVARGGWNGQGMFVYLVPANLYKATTEAAEKFFGPEVPYRAYLALKTAQGDVAPWSVSNSDILAVDWYIVH